MRVSVCCKRKHGTQLSHLVFCLCGWILAETRKGHAYWQLYGVTSDLPLTSAAIISPAVNPS